MSEEEVRWLIEQALEPLEAQIIRLERLLAQKNARMEQFALALRGEPLPSMAQVLEEVQR